MSYKPLYVAYLVYFNRDTDYFECHEVLEELWLDEDRDTRYKGLLQVAVALFHVRNNNIRGGLMMFKSALSYLAPYPDVLLGIDLGKLRRELGDYILKLEEYTQQPFPYYDLTIDVVDPILASQVAEAGLHIQPILPLKTDYKRK